MAERMSGASPMTGRVSNPNGFASYAPSVGFAAAMSGGRTTTERPTVSGTKKPARSSAAPVDKEHARKLDSSAPARELPTFVAGRKINLAKKGNDWRPFQERLQKENRRLGKAVEASHLILKFLTDEESLEMFAARFPESRAMSRGKELNRIRSLVNKINAFSEREQANDLKREKQILSASPDLAHKVMQRMLDPDNPEWFGEGVDLDGPVEREQVSAWLPANFYAPKIGRSSPSTVSVELTDTSSVLKRGRERFVDAMGSEFGFDISGVSAEWTPEMDIFRTTGGRSLDGLHVTIPSMPLIMPLKSPHVYES